MAVKKMLPTIMIERILGLEENENENEFSWMAANVTNKEQENEGVTQK